MFSTYFTSSALKLDISLCGLGKQQPDDKIFCIAPKTVHNFRQDAAFYDENFVLVNDGVGGWDQYGVDSSAYSANLTYFLSESERKKCETEKEIRKRWKKAYESMKNEGIQGSTTVLEASFCPDDDTLKIANLGDCKLSVFRKNTKSSKSTKVVYSSTPQSYRFNFPYQLSSRTDAIFEEGIRAAVINSLELKSGDVIIIGSDGIWDNLYEKKIIKIIQKKDPESLAKKLVKQARLFSSYKNICSPFCKKCVEAGYWKDACLGGKLDDATVAVIIVK
jgi:protein phosphatase PTC7